MDNDFGPLRDDSVMVESIIRGFVTGIRSDAPSSIEDVLSQHSHVPRRMILRELILEEIGFRAEHGEQPAPAEYEIRFPEDVAVVRKVFGLPTSDAAALPNAHQQPVLRRRPATDVRFEGPLRLLDEPARYEFDDQDKLDEGGMGVIYRSRDRQFGRTLAVKVLREEYQGDSEMERRFIEEAQITGSLQHPSIVPVHELGWLTGDRLFFAMKLVDGDNLRRLLDKRSDPAIDRHELIRVFEQIADAVAYAHEQEVIHRDLKPANIIVGSFGEVQVMDWGLAKRLTAPPTSGPSNGDRDEDAVVEGTLPYMPPEQASGRVAQVGKQSDVFALGAILCHILTGQPPYLGATFPELWRQARDCDLEPCFSRVAACGADAELIELARACLAPDWAARPADAEAVRRSISTYRTSAEERVRAAELAKEVATTNARHDAPSPQAPRRHCGIGRACGIDRHGDHCIPLVGSRSSSSQRC